MKPRRFHWPAIATSQPGVPLAPLWVRLAWMAGIWAASVITLLLVALLLRLVLKV
jgi:hypothetical protein